MKSGLALGSLLVVGVAAGALFLGQGGEAPFTAVASQGKNSGDASAPAWQASVHASIDGSADAASDAASDRSSDAPAFHSPSERSAHAEDAPSSLTSSTELSRLERIRPSSPHDELRADASIEASSHDSADVRRLEVRANTEARDPEWSDDTERLLADAVAKHAAGLAAFEASPPYCSGTTCRVIATSSRDSGAADADWQALVRGIMSDPGMRDRFIDQHTDVQEHPSGSIHVIYLERRSGHRMRNGNHPITITTSRSGTST